MPFVRPAATLLICAVVFGGALLVTLKIGPKRPLQAASDADTVETTPAVTAGPTRRAQMRLALSAIESAQQQRANPSSSIPVSELSFVNRLYLGEAPRALGIKNGIRRALRVPLKGAATCFGHPPDQDTELQYRYHVESTGNRLVITNVGVSRADGAALPLEVKRCLDAQTMGPFETTAEQILPGALRTKYDPNNFFVTASFEDSEPVMLWAATARPETGTTALK
jgi:hypothetical protein